MINPVEVDATEVSANVTVGSAAIERAARARHLAVDRVAPQAVLVRIDGHALPFVDIYGPDSSGAARSVGDRLDTQRLIAEQRDVPFPRGEIFEASDYTRALQYASLIGWPVAVRSAHCVSRSGAFANVNESDFQEAWHKAAHFKSRRKWDRGSHYVVVEQHVSGQYVQMFVVDGHVISATRVDPAVVVGNGVDTIAQLIDRKNQQRATHPYLAKHPIPVRVNQLDALARHGRDVAEVPPPDEVVALQSLPKAGIEIVDVTEAVDSEMTGFAVRSLAMIPGLPYGLVELILPPERSPIVNQVLYSWPPLGHIPTSGQPRDIGGAVLEHYLTAPQWQRRREPETIATAGDIK